MNRARVEEGRMSGVMGDSEGGDGAILGSRAKGGFPCDRQNLYVAKLG